MIINYTDKQTYNAYQKKTRIFLHRLYTLFPHEKYIVTLKMSTPKINTVKTISAIYVIKAKHV